MSNSIYQRCKKFIQSAQVVHGGKYGYDKVEYINANEKVIIVCPIHGDFKQAPAKHFSKKQGCPTCGGTKMKSTDEFINQALAVHGNDYEYILVDYKSSLNKVQIICHVHGVFKQTPKDHLMGCGCPKCGGRAPLTQSDFTTRSTIVHNNKYDYSLAKYKTDRDKVVIICPHHGKFKQAPIGHMRGQGCALCNQTGGYSEKLFTKNNELKSRDARIYLLQFANIAENVTFLKVGITQSSIKHRFCSGYAGYQYEILLDKPMKLYDAFLLEQNVLRMFGKTKIKPAAPFGGRTECFTMQYKNDIINTILLV